MSTTSPDKVGKVRIRLAELLNKAIPTATFEPHKIDSQVPVYANPKWDCCSWYADGRDNETELNVHVACWDTMSKCVKFGIEVWSADPYSHTRFAWEACSKDDPKMNYGAGFGLPD